MESQSKVFPLSDQARNLVAEINNSAVPSKTIGDICDEALIPQGIDIPKPESVFSLDGIPVFTKKSLSTLTGKAKSGKTTCTAWVMAQAINQKLSVLWIDTEQGQYYGSRTQFWVLSISGQSISHYLKFYDLKIHNPTIRTQILQHLIETITPDIVVIDGIRDLVFDINSAEEATNTTGNLMRLADIFNCHILSIIHQNKANDHLRGHLGTEMVNKSETVIRVSQNEQKLIVCEPEFTRGEDFRPFAFERDGAGMPLIVDYQPKITSSESNAKKIMPIDVDNKTHLNCLIRAFGIEKRLQYSELIPSISAAFESLGQPMGVVKTKGFIQYYIQTGMLIKAEKAGNKTYYEIKFD